MGDGAAADAIVWILAGRSHSASLSHPLLISSLTLLISRQLMLIYVRCVCVLCEPPTRLSVYPSSPPQPIAHNGVCHLVIANYLHTLYGLAQFEAQIARALSAKRESEPVLMLAAIPMTMTLMRKCVCIALYTISRLIE